MKRLIYTLLILLQLSGSAGAAAREVERTEPITPVRTEPTREVSLPPMDLPPMNTEQGGEPLEEEKEPEPVEVEVKEPEEKESPVKVPEPAAEDEGLEFKMYNANGVMAFAVIADHERYELRPVLAKGHIPGRDTVKHMSDEYQAIAAVNGSYFGLSGVILGNTKIDGVTAGTTYYARSTIGINADGTVIFGMSNYYGRVSIGEESAMLGGVNDERGTDSVVIYNKWQGKSTGTNDFGSEYVVEGGKIKEINRRKGNSRIPMNGYVVSMHGKEEERFAKAQLGERVILDESMVNIEETGEFDRALHVLGAGPRLVKDGTVYVTAGQEEFPADIRNGRAPRTAFGVTKYGDYILAVVDGRQAHSKGCTLSEWAEIMLNEFGAIDAINLDGGGSTELVVKGELVNIPSDGKERAVGDALIIVAKQ